MQPAGHKTVALWREAGEWWSGEPYREVRRIIRENGTRFEEERTLPCVGGERQSTILDAYTEDHTEEWSLKKYKLRDEKVAKATGIFESSRYNAQRKPLPDYENDHPYDHKRQPANIAAGRGKVQALSYAPLHVVSGYAFGRGCMLADELSVLAAHAGISAIAITDPFSLVGAVEHVRQAQKSGIKPIIGATFEMSEGGEVVLLARNKSGYTNLSQLVTACHLEEPRQFPLCTWDRLERFSDGLLCLTGGDCGPLNGLLIKREYTRAKALVERLVRLYGRECVFLEIDQSFLPWDMSTNDLLLQLGRKVGVRCVAGGLVTHARRDHFPVQDILVCAESLCVVDEIVGRKPRRHSNQQQIEQRPERALNAERFLKTPVEMYELHKANPELLANTLHVAELCDADVLPERTELPKLYSDEGYVLREFTYAGAHLYHGKISSKLKKRLNVELERITRLNYSGHFLVMWDACRWASDQGILFSGRGSVVDSAVAYCLGFSRIDAFSHNLHFDRFLPEDGSKRPDIDIDFEARHRDKIRNYLTNKYGQDKVATVAAVGAYCTRGIVREVGKALGLPNELIGFLAKRIHGGISPHHLEKALEKRPELRGSAVPKERFQWVFRLAERLMDIPRNIRAHSSGVVISSRPLSETVPVMWSASTGTPGTEEQWMRIIQWDKRSAKYYFDKFDVLCLRGQDVLSGTQQRVRLNDLDFRVQNLPINDEHTYSAMRSGELIGIPQSASPAMRQAHIRLRTTDLHDASLVQAGIRPGVGGAVKLNELIARRRGNKQYSFSHPELERILGLTYGITVFQEQVDQLLQSFCGCSSGEAEALREQIHERRREDYGRMIREKLTNLMVEQGHSHAIAEEVFELVAGFKGYGFAQGHALAFAEISIRSIYCQQNYPAEYFSALLSAQPAGYYGPCTLVNEARSRGVAILPPDVNRSQLEFSVEDIQSDMDPRMVFPGGAIRVGLNQISGVSEQTKIRISALHDEAADGRTTPGDEAYSGTQVFTNYGSSSRFSSHSLRPHTDRATSMVRETIECLQTQTLQVSELSKAVIKRYCSFPNFVAKVRPSRDELERLILCGALDSLHPNRRAMLWAIPVVQKYSETCMNPDELPFEMPEPELPTGIEDFTAEEKAIYERMFLDLDVSKHLMAHERERVRAKGGITTSEARRLVHGRKAIVVGNPIRLRFPPTPSGKRVVFFDLEDETGLLNVTCFDSVYQLDGHAIVCSPYITLIGEAQDRDGHIAFLAKRAFPYNPVIASNKWADRTLPVTTGDFLVG